MRLKENLLQDRNVNQARAVDLIRASEVTQTQLAEISGEGSIDPFLGVICPGFYMGVVLSQSANSVLQGMVCAHKCSHTTLIHA